jgi:aminoglycoside phosphotransferase (APT) family kinase protein
VDAWYRATLPELGPVAGISALTGGMSNITCLVTHTSGARSVLRRPPIRAGLATAHDVRREHRVLAALAPTGFPVPTPLAICTDKAVLGADFYVMDAIDGIVAHTAADIEAVIPVDRRAAIGTELAATLARLHEVDPEVVGLGSLGRHTGFVERQLTRWLAQYEKSVSEVDPRIVHAHDALARAIPPPPLLSIVHGDFRLGNVILGGDGTLRTVIDWEVCTLGDPLSDLGYLIATWVEADDALAAHVDPPSALPGFARRASVIEAYFAASSTEPRPIGFYVAFSYWKLACILSGARTRMAASARGESVTDLSQITDRIENATLLAGRHLDLGASS